MSLFWRRVAIGWLLVPAQAVLLYSVFATWGQVWLTGLFAYFAVVHLVVTVDQIKRRGLEIQPMKERSVVWGLCFGFLFVKPLLQLPFHPERFWIRFGDSILFLLILIPYILFLGPLRKKSKDELAQTS